MPSRPIGRWTQFGGRHQQPAALGDSEAVQPFADSRIAAIGPEHPRVVAALQDRVTRSIRAALLPIPLAIPLLWLGLTRIGDARRGSIWCAAALVTGAIQWFFVASRPPGNNFKRRIVATQLLSGAVWGLYPLTTMQDSEVGQVIAGAALVSVLAASGLFASAMRAAFIAFLIPAAVVSSLTFAFIGSGDARWMAAVIMAATTFYLYLAEGSHQAYVEAEVLSLRLDHQAHTDTLTGLSNRKALDSTLQLALDETKGLPERVGLAYLDLDGFKAINDEHGHDAGDRALIAVARRFRSALSSTELAARIGGDEFVIVQRESTPATLDDLQARLSGLFSEPFKLDGAKMTIGCSIGITTVEEGSSTTAALRQADRAQYAAKRKTRAQFGRPEPGLGYLAGDTSHDHR